MVAELHSALHRPFQESASTRPVRQACPAQRPRTNAPVPITRFRSSVKNSTLPAARFPSPGQAAFAMQRPGPPARSATNSTPANSYAIVTRKAMVEFKQAVATEEELRQNRPRWPQCRARHNATGADRALELDDWESVARRSTHDHSLAKRKRHGIPPAGRSVYRPLTGRCGRVCGTRRGGTSAWSMRRLWMGPDMAGSHPPRGALVGRCRGLRAAGGDVFAGTETGAPGPATSGRARRPKRGADCALNSLVAGVAEFLPCSFSKPATWGCRVRLQSQDAGPSRVHGGDTNLD